ncbi:hypothetical protein ACTNDZ_11095 [Selenomonas montiformis]|uniref:hypothetical protein n=1 Tax=Selenomonas montiformis TaxID=2652285 RepID=UPI003F8B70F7
MLKKIFLFITIFATMFFPQLAQAKEPAVLGVDRTQWVQDLKIIGGDYEFSEHFLDWVDSFATELKMKRDVEHYQDIGVHNDSPREKKRKNPLIQLKPQKVRSEHLTDLNMDKQTYYKVIHYIPYLGNYYSEKHIAQLLPYIVLCFNYNISTSDVNYYIKSFVRKQTPPDVACLRLYQVVESVS